MKFSLFIARRTALRTKRTDGSRASRSPAVGVAITSVALSLTVMICAVAIVSGFKQQIIDKIVGFNGHLQIFRVVENNPESENDYTSDLPDNLITLTPSLKNILDNEDYILDYELELTVPSILKTENDFKGVYFKGSDGSYFRKFLSTQIIEGEMPDYSQNNDSGITISSDIASELGLSVGDTIPTFYLQDEIKARRYKVAAIYSTHFEHFDDLIAIADMTDLQSAAGIDKGKGVNIRILTDDFNKADEYGKRLQQRLNEAYIQGLVNYPYRVETLTTRGAAYFSWLQLLDTNVIVILALMTVVACITLIAAMLILIIDKIKLIGVLRSMGASKHTIGNIFIFMAVRIASIGLLIGNIVGIGICSVQKHWHILPLDADSYYIDYVPVNLDILALLLINAGIIAVIILSLLLPAMYAGRISPSEAMRYQE